MSDEPTAGHAAAPATTATPETPADAWGQPISPERQMELKALAERQREWAATPEAQRGESAFRGVRLSGADVS